LLSNDPCYYIFNSWFVYENMIKFYIYINIQKKISYNFMRIIIQRVLTAGVKVNLE